MLSVDWLLFLFTFCLVRLPLLGLKHWHAFVLRVQREHYALGSLVRVHDFKHLVIDRF